jgi:F0F1-type ATP synthase assembly protein I
MVPFNPPIPDSKQPNKGSSGVKSLAEAEKLMQIAILLPSSACIGWLAGAWLDSHFHQTWMGLAGILFGGFSGLVYVVRLVMAGTSRTTSTTGDQSGTGGDGSKL